MKRIYLLLFLCLGVVSAVAQAPVRFTYQAVVRNADGVPYTTDYKVRISIWHNAPTEPAGQRVYQEDHKIDDPGNPNVSVNGEITLTIGEGTNKFGSLESIDWGDGTYYLVSQYIDDAFDNVFASGSVQLLSVPYALFANRVGGVVPTSYQVAPAANGYTVSVTFSDGQVQTFALQNGNDGPQGPTGSTGPTGPQGAAGVSPTVTVNTTSSQDSVLIVVDSAGVQSTYSIRHGQRGPAGPAGQPYPFSPTVTVSTLGNNIIIIIPSSMPVSLTHGTDGPQGPQGPRGPRGVSGVSPSITFSPAGSGDTVVTITDTLGNHAFIVRAGAQGASGSPGAPGTTGASPIVSTQTVGDGILLTVNTAGVQQQYMISNGKSAYQAWLDAGHTGSETDFLSGLELQSLSLSGRNLSIHPGNSVVHLPDSLGTTQQGLSAYQAWLNAGHTGTEADYLQSLRGGDGTSGVTPVVTIEVLDSMRTRVTITSAAYPQGQSFVVRNGIDGSSFVQVQSDWNETSTGSPAYIQNKPTLSAVATTGNYNDLQDRPTLFDGNYNSLTNRPVIPTVPTNVSAFANNAGYISNNGCDTVNFCGLANLLQSLSDTLDVIESRIDTTIVPPTVHTNAVQIAGLTAHTGGEVLSDGGSPVTGTGVCWDTVPNPTLSHNHTIDVSWQGLFSSTLLGLSPATLYYVRAYATNAAGTGYGNEVTFTSGCPVFAIDIAGAGSICQGEAITLVASGGVNYVWNTGAQTASITVTPTNFGTTTYTVTATDADGCTATASKTVIVNPVFSQSVSVSVCDSELPYTWSGQTYTASGDYTRTFQTINGCDSVVTLHLTVNMSATTQISATALDSYTWNGQTYTASGDYVQHLQTVDGCDSAVTLHLTINHIPAGDAQPCPGTPTVTDYDGNVYNTVKIGNQCWMKENLRVTHYADGTEIPAGGSNTSTTDPYYYDDSNSNIPLAARGYFYNWPAAMHGAASSNSNPSNVQGVCPIGWHLPSDAEWTQLTNYVGNQSEYQCGGSSDNIAKALASTEYWNNNYSGECIPGDQSQHANNATGFSAVPTGYYSGSSFQNAGFFADFWSCSMYTSNNVWIHTLTYVAAYVHRGNSNNKYTGISVRCVLGAGENLPTVTTAAVSNIGTTTATCGGNVTYDGNTTVTARGVCWNTTGTPTTSDAHTTDGSGTGAFTSNITGLQPGTTYYVRAYATNSMGTVYGNEVSFTTLAIPAGDAQPCPGTPTVTDYDGNVYNTVKIGQQCWMKENLRTTHYADGSEVIAGTTASSTEPYRYDNSGSNITLEKRGYLYNWPAVMHGAGSSTANPSGVQGICPTGWHVPSDAEWTQLTDYVGSVPAYQCGSNSTYVAKALADSTGWNSYTGTCAVGNNLNQNNATGYGASPAGYYNGIYGSGNSAAYFWSATEPFIGSAFYRYLNSTYTNMESGTRYKSDGYSVRCVLGDGANLSVVTTSNVTNIGATTATCGGNVTYDGNTTVTARGVCWNTTGTPTLNDSHTTDGSGTGSFISSLTGLQTNITYYVRAYATNSMGTVYGNEVVFTTGCPSFTVSISGDDQVCFPNSTVLRASGATSYVWSTGATVPNIGVVLAQTTTYTVTGTDAWGCTATATKTVIAFLPDNTTLHVSACDSYEWNGEIYTQSGDYTQTFQNVHGCDSVVTLHLTILPATLLSYSDNMEVLANTPVTLMATGANVVTWTDVDGAVIGTGNTVTVTPDDTTIYTFTGHNEDVNLVVNGDFEQGNTGFTSDYSYSNTMQCRRYTIQSDAYNYLSDTHVSGIDGNNFMIVDGYNSSSAIVWSQTVNVQPGMLYAFSAKAVSLNASLPFAQLQFLVNGTPIGVLDVNRPKQWLAFNGIWSSGDDTTATLTIIDLTNSCGNNDFGLDGIHFARMTSCDATASVIVEVLHIPAGDAQPCPNNPTVTDYDGNVYNTVKIGQQCWMKENLRTTHYADGVEIPFSTGATSHNNPYYYDFNIPTIPFESRGYLYNWAAAMHGASSSATNPSGVQGICPTGWHVPSDAEWTQLADYVGSVPAYQCNGNSSNIAKALAAETGWDSTSGECYPGDQSLYANNATGFSAIPSGEGMGGSLFYPGQIACIWSSTEGDLDNAWYRQISYGGITLSSQIWTYVKFRGRSVRCLLGDGANLPAVTTSAVSNITANTATCGGNVTYDGNTTVTARGVCWNTTGMPTLYDSDSLTFDGMGTGSFTSTLTGLHENTTYYVRAYATNSRGTVYGEERVFTTESSISSGDAQPCPNNPTVTDYDGNVYNTVKIGNQCWMKENLRTTHFADGTDINYAGGATGSNNNLSNTDECYYTTAGDAATYGYVYNWLAAMHRANGSAANPSGLQGVCPNGWHVPSNAEWNQLFDYVRSVPAYGCNGNTNSINKALASDFGWQSTGSACTPGNDMSSNNSTGFNAMPAGGNGGFGQGFYVWSATPSSSTQAYCVDIYRNYAAPVTVSRDYNDTRTVRCVLGAGVNPPSVTTGQAKQTGNTTAYCGGEVTADNGAAVTERGICWSAYPNQNPTVGGPHAASGNGIGTFTADLTGLDLWDTVYFVRAYAINSAGTAYGDVIPLYLYPVVPKTGTETYDMYYNTVSVFDHAGPWTDYDDYCDGQLVITAPTANMILQISGDYNTEDCCDHLLIYDGNGTNVQLADLHGTGSIGTPILTTGNTVTLRFASDFSVTNPGFSLTVTAIQPVVPGSVIISGYDVVCDGGTTTLTATSDVSGTYTWSNGVTGPQITVGAGTYTVTVTSATGNSLSSYPFVVYGAQSATVSVLQSACESYTWNGTTYTQSGDYTKHLTTLMGCDSTVTLHLTIHQGTHDAYTEASNGSYTWHGQTYTESGVYTYAYTNDDGCPSVDTLHLTVNHIPAGDAQPCPNNPTVTDYDGNVYNTVKIGNQCWMKENLRTTHYADGAAIPAGTSGSTSDPYYYVYSGLDAALYGYLYNWPAVMHGAGSTNTIPSDVQGVCPAGWHLPSDAEWTQLLGYVSSMSVYQCDGNSGNIAKALAATDGWYSYGGTCKVGDTPSGNNATGFGAMPAGFYNNGCGSSGDFAFFYGATQSSGSNALYYYLSADNANVTRASSAKSRGYSVRCLLGSGVSLPAVTTAAVSNIGTSTATSGGNVTSDGGATVTVRGVCWNTTGTPTTADAHTTDGSGVGTFTSSLTGLQQGATYYVRAYATNSVGTAYGNEVTFTTLAIPAGDAQPCPNNPTVTDYDGNTYNTVKIGNQCWMKENLRVTHYASGVEIPMGSSGSLTIPYRYCPDNSSANVIDYGYLYNWPAVMNGSNSSNANPSGIQGVCPTGWHVPSDAEWYQLTNYVSSVPAYVCGNNTSSIAKALAAITGWNTSSAECAPGNDQSQNNITGFNVLAAGHWDYGYRDFGTHAWIWSSTQDCANNAWYRLIQNEDNSVIRLNVNCSANLKHRSFAVRCLLGDGANLPAVTTDAASGVSLTSATCGGNVTYDGNTTVTARGLCWNTTGTPTLSDSHTYDGTGTGTFTTTIMGLQQGVTYYVRAYATNSMGTVYGNEVTFTTFAIPTGDAQPCPNNPTVTDYDGNVYNTVKIGNQCWMTENLRTTHYADGAAISVGTSGSTTASFYYVYSGLDAALYGYLYNWPAVMHGAGSTTANPSGVQGICPAGWHLPSDAEWTQLTNYVSSVPAYRCDGNSSNIAKALAAVDGWYSYGGACKVGDTPSDNNNTGFTAMPAGYYNAPACGSSGDYAFFWSATQSSNNSAWYRYMYADNANVSRGNSTKSRGYSVRCLLGSGVSLPTVTTAAVSNIGTTTATGGGNVTSDGGATVTARGVCWSSTNVIPTINDSHTTDSSGVGTFTSALANLSMGTTYYVRAYATNSMGTAYGNVVVIFTTLAIPAGDAQPCPNNPTVTDYDGNVYNTVKIGNQCWMKENLRVTHYADGVEIPAGNTSSYTDAYRYAPNNNAGNVTAYGYLYNWAAVMHGAGSNNDNPGLVQGVCPTGWHLPSSAEWDQLTNYVSSVPVYQCGGNSSYIVKALASNQGWSTGYSNTCSVGNDLSTNNATGFSAMPACYYNWEGYGMYFGRDASFWSSTAYSNTQSRSLRIYTPYRNLYSDIYLDNRHGLSVRCLLGAGTNLPAVTTAAMTNVTLSTATGGGNVTSDGGATVTARGVCWSTSHNPTTANAHTTNGSGTGAFTSTLTGLAQGTTYYVRAYATNSMGTAYGNEVTFTTLAIPAGDAQPCPNNPTVTDYDGNVYNTVKIGNQCWMKENLRVTHYADGTEIPATGSGVISNNSPYCYLANGDGNLVSIYGRLYNYTAVMHGSPSSSANPSGVQGVCPQGWHLPSSAEWNQLTSYVASVPAYVCGNGNSIAKALSAAQDWNTSTNNCAVGNDLSTNNATGFSALPTGYVNGYANFDQFHEATYFRSTNEYNSYRAHFRYFLYNVDTVYIGEQNYKSDGMSVRCVLGAGESLPTVTTAAVSNIGTTTATGGGNVTSDGGATVTARGVCWSTSHTPTTANAHTTNGSGTGAFTSTLTNLTPNTTYYVRAYATNSMGTAYGNEVSFTTNAEVVPTWVNITGDNVSCFHPAENVGGMGGTEAYTGTILTASSDAAGTYTWSNGMTGPTVTVGAGTYTVTITTSTGNTLSSSPFTVEDFVPFVDVQLSDTAICYGQAITVHPVLGNGTLQSYKLYRINLDDANYSDRHNDTPYLIVDQNFGNVYANVSFDIAGPYWINFVIQSTGGCLAEYFSPVITVLPTASSEFTVTSTGSYTWNGQTYTSSGDYTQHFTAANGCDSAVTLHLTVNNVPGNDAQPCPNNPTVTDYDGNVYNTVQIGNQCWMKENLRVTHYADGLEIPFGGARPTGSNVLRYSDRSSLYYVNSSLDNVVYGYLYNRPAAMHGASSSNSTSRTLQGVCPTGWHIPSDSEWTQLMSYVSSVPAYWCNGDISYVAKALASTTGWNSGTDECTPSDQSHYVNNITGFSAVPAGNCVIPYSNVGVRANFWSSTDINAWYTYYYILSYDNALVIRDFVGTSVGLSVRCLLGSGANPPTVTTGTAKQTGNTSAYCSGNVTADNGATVTERGVCWSTSHNPTVGGDHAAAGSGTGTFTADLSGLTPGGTYYIRAYATNSMGTAYGEETTLTLYTVVPMSGTETYTMTGNTLTVYDHAGPTADYDNNCDGLLVIIAPNNCSALSISGSYNTENCCDHLYIYDGTGTNVQLADLRNSGSIGTPIVSTGNTLILQFTSDPSVLRSGFELTVTAVPLSTAIDTVVCTGALPYSWHGQNITGAGTYTATLHTAANCDSTVTLTVYASASPTLAHTPDTVVNSVPVILRASGADRLIWTDANADTLGLGGTLIVSPTATTTYYVTGINNNGNLVVNGDFEQGNTGFTTAYSYVNDGSYGHYYIAHENHEMWSWDTGDTIFDHTTGNGQWMMVDAYNGRNVWSQTVNVTPNTNYEFSAWFVTDNIANVRFEINDMQGEVFTTPQQRGVWERRRILWNSGSNTTATLKITSGYATSGGNDFGIDDIVFAEYPSCSTTEAITVTVNNIPAGDAQPCPGTSTVTDYDGNVYNTVKIGNQCWMKENLRTTHYADGIEIPAGNTMSDNVAYRYSPNEDNSTVAVYGYLYNWPAVMHGASSSSANPSGVQGICPSGWHVPSRAEWEQLTGYVSGQSQYVCGSDVPKALASTAGWNSSSTTCTVGNNPGANNATGFTALPAGIYGGVSGHVGDGFYFGISAEFWSSTENNNNEAYARSLNYDGVYVYWGYNGEQYGYSVRCVLGAGANPPAVTTSAVSNIGANSATSGGNVTSDGGATVTARGVCWNTTGTPTLSDSHTTDGTGTGTFTSSITGLQPNTTYYVRAYATNSVGTLYGNEVTFTTPCATYFLSDDFNDGIIDPAKWTYTGNAVVEEDGQLKLYQNVTDQDVHLRSVDMNVPANGKVSMDRRYWLHRGSSGSEFFYPRNVFLLNGDVNSWVGVEYTYASYYGTGYHTSPLVGIYLYSNLDGVETRIRLCDVAFDTWLTEHIEVDFTAGTLSYYRDTLMATVTVPGLAGRNVTYYNADFHPYGWFTGHQHFMDYVDIYGDMGLVTTSAVSNIGETTATCGGNVTYDGCVTVTARGVCYGTSHNPTLNDSHTTDGTGTGTFTSSIMGLQPGTTYYVRAYATTNLGTLYGNEVSFTTTDLCSSFAVRILGDTAVCSGSSTTLHAMVPGAVPPVAVGDILCTDNTTVKPADFAASGKTAMGVVFHVDGTGLHGWAVHLNESTSVRWGGYGTDIPTLTNYEVTRIALIDTAGYANTAAIRAYGDASAYPLAWSVDFDNGWYLPAIGQLRTLYGELPTLNISLQIVGGAQFSMNGNLWYWSSSENSGQHALGVTGSGFVTTDFKSSGNRLRSVRSF